MLVWDEDSTDSFLGGLHCEQADKVLRPMPHPSLVEEDVSLPICHCRKEYRNGFVVFHYHHNDAVEKDVQYLTEVLRCVFCQKYYNHTAALNSLEVKEIE